MSRARGQGFTNPTRIDEAKRIFFANLPPYPLESEEIAVRDALTRHLGNDVVSPVDLPAFDKSTVDGYAVISEDASQASASNPAVLQLTGESRIGERPTVKVTRGTAVAIATGAPVPEGANAVVMIEDTKRFADERIEVHSPLERGENISKTGDDTKKGSLLLRRGTRLMPQDIGLLTALGYRTVKVVRAPFAGILSTGNELLEPDQAPEDGKVVDVNRAVIPGMLKEAGAITVDLGIARDDEAEIESKIRDGLRRCDLLAVTAGTSVGRRDLVPEIVNSLGKPGVLVHGVAMRPALPTGLAVVNKKPVLLLPGFPVSAIIAFTIFGAPLIARMLGGAEEPQTVIKAKLTKNVAGVPGLRTFVRVVVNQENGQLRAQPLSKQAASSLTTLTSANGILTIPEDSAGFDAAQEVEIVLIRPIRET